MSFECFVGSLNEACITKEGSFALPEISIKMSKYAVLSNDNLKTSVNFCVTVISCPPVYFKEKRVFIISLCKFFVSVAHIFLQNAHLIACFVNSWVGCVTQDAQLVVKAIHVVMGPDSCIRSHPIVTKVKTTDEINAMFDVIAYKKVSGGHQL